MLCACACVFCVWITRARYQLVELLLKHNVDVMAMNGIKERWTALQAAVQGNHTKTALRLIEVGVCVEGGHGEPALVYAYTRKCMCVCEMGAIML